VQLHLQTHNILATHLNQLLHLGNLLLRLNNQQWRTQQNRPEALNGLSELAVRRHLIGLLQAANQIARLQANRRQNALGVLSVRVAARIGVEGTKRRQCRKTGPGARIRLNKDTLVLGEVNHAHLIIQ